MLATMHAALQSVVVGNPFFNEAREQSQVKATIISKYFWSWANVFKGQVEKIAYVDLFAGPGRYDDGTKSTPLLILEQAIADPVFRTKLITVFNDGDPSHVASLKGEIARLPGVGTLRYPPNIDNELVGDAIANELQSIRLVPTLCFIDPFGYKGLSLKLVNSILKDFGCECIFFFNYNRINMGVTNGLVRTHMEALFSPARMTRLRDRLAGLGPNDREFAVIEALTEALKEMGGKYVLPFRFRNGAGTRTSHHLIFVSKNELGYRIMKTVMANESSQHDQGVPSFEYSAADARFPALFELTRPLDALEAMLLTDFAGRTISTRALITEHHINRPFIDPNYKDALRKLEAKGAITADPAAPLRIKRKGIVTFADAVMVTLSRKELMGLGSSIEWTEATWNPTTGCDKISPGCKHCYAERMSERLQAMGQPNYRHGFRLRLHDHMLAAPLKWKRPQTIFVNSMSDLFHDEVPLAFIQRVFSVMAEASWHRFQVLTKRAERLESLSSRLIWPANVWMGVSVESKGYAYRIDHLRRTDAAIKFLSLEPLLGRLNDLALHEIDWVIVGGESGPGARPMNATWVTEIRDQCVQERVAFFFKQWGGVNKKRAGRLLDGRTWDELPRSSVRD